MTQPRYVIGYDVGGTKLGIGLASTDGKLLGSAMLPNKDTYPEDVLPEALRISKQLLADAGLSTKDLAAFGISSPYPADPVNGIMTAPTNNKFWRNVPIRKYFEDNLGIAGCFENDANCAALAEWFFGAGRGCKDFIFLTMSTGIGAGIIAADKLVRGKGFFAGELGHMVVKPDGRYCNCGLRGCYEAYCGGRAIANRMAQELKDQPDSMIMKLAAEPGKPDMRTLEAAYRANDPYAVALWQEMSLRNAQAIGLFINAFNPQRIVLGTLAWAVGDIFIDPILKELPRFCWKELLDVCEIVPSELKREISSYAGIAAALNYLKENGKI